MRITLKKGSIAVGRYTFGQMGSLGVMLAELCIHMQSQIRGNGDPGRCFSLMQCVHNLLNCRLMKDHARISLNTEWT